MEQGRDRPARSGATSAGDAEAQEFAAVLAHASQPVLPDGAMARLMAKVAAGPQQAAGPAKVIALEPRTTARRPFWRFAAAVPLAASLALGVYLGARGSFDFMMPSAITGDFASSDDGQVDDLGGVGDIDAYAQDGTT